MLFSIACTRQCGEYEKPEQCFANGCTNGDTRCFPTTFRASDDTFSFDPVLDKMFHDFINSGTPSQSFTLDYMEKNTLRIFGGDKKKGFQMRGYENVLFMKTKNYIDGKEVIEEEFNRLNEISQIIEDNALTNIHVPKKSKYYTDDYFNQHEDDDRDKYTNMYIDYIWYVVDYFQSPKIFEEMMNSKTAWPTIIHKPRNWTKGYLNDDEFVASFRFTTEESKNFKVGLEELKIILNTIYIADLQVLPLKVDGSLSKNTKKGIAIIDPLKIIAVSNLEGEKLEDYNDLIANIETMIDFLNSELAEKM
jgi:hypothetical protein